MTKEISKQVIFIGFRRISNNLDKTKVFEKLRLYWKGCIVARSRINATNRGMYSNKMW